MQNYPFSLVAVLYTELVCARVECEGASRKSAYTNPPIPNSYLAHQITLLLSKEMAHYQFYYIFMNKKKSNQTEAKGRHRAR